MLDGTLPILQDLLSPKDTFKSCTIGCDTIVSKFVLKLIHINQWNMQMVFSHKVYTFGGGTSGNLGNQSLRKEEVPKIGINLSVIRTVWFEAHFILRKFTQLLFLMLWLDSLHARHFNTKHKYG